MSELWQQIQDGVGYIRARAEASPEVGIILGTGLGELGGRIEAEATIPFAEIPHFPRSTALTHQGNLILGRLGGRAVVAMQGRVHYYEGYTMRQVTLPVRVMRALGAGTLVMSNAVGGMNPQLRPGDLTVITDHINFMGDNPLIGPNDDRLGPRFPDMSAPYDRGIVELAEAVALEQRIPLRRAVYVAVAGPNLETAAEYRFLRAIGADTVGMSIVPECLAAVHGGMRVLGLSVVTDACFPDALQPADIDEIVRTANEAQPKLEAIVSGVLQRLPSSER